MVSIKLALPLVAAFALFGSSTASASGAAEPSAYVELQRNTWYLPTKDGAARLYVTEMGRGSPVVFLHGGPGNDFQYMVEPLDRHRGEHRFVLFDDRGSLLSPVAQDRRDTLTLSALVDDLDALRQSLGLQKLTLFGHSFGSLLALSYYQAHPDRVERLVLTGAFPPATSMKALVAGMRPRQKALRERPEVAETLKREGLDRPPSELTPKQLSERARITGLAAISTIDLRRWRDAVGGGIYYSEATDSAIGDTFPSAFDFRAVIKAHPVPISIIQGDRDYIDPGASGWRGFKAANPELPIALTVLPHATHNAWIDDPAAFSRAVRKALP